jgi:hypothetical protein
VQAQQSCFTAAAACARGVPPQYGGRACTPRPSPACLGPRHQDLRPACAACRGGLLHAARLYQHLCAGCRDCDGGVGRRLAVPAWGRLCSRWGVRWGGVGLGSSSRLGCCALWVVAAAEGAPCLFRVRGTAGTMKQILSSRIIEITKGGTNRGVPGGASGHLAAGGGREGCGWRAGRAGAGRACCPLLGLVDGGLCHMCVRGGGTVRVCGTRVRCLKHGCLGVHWTPPPGSCLPPSLVPPQSPSRLTPAR